MKTSSCITWPTMAHNVTWLQKMSQKPSITSCALHFWLDHLTWGKRVLDKHALLSVLLDAGSMMDVIPLIAIIPVSLSAKDSWRQTFSSCFCQILSWLCWYGLRSVGIYCKKKKEENMKRLRRRCIRLLAKPKELWNVAFNIRCNPWITLIIARHLSTIFAIWYRDNANRMQVF